MTLVRAFLLLMVLGNLPARAMPPVDHLTADSEARWVPFELTTGNQIRFRAVLNGRWIDAVLDTGASDTAVSSRFARLAGMKPLVRARADAIGGAVALDWTSLDRIEVGGLVRTGGRIAIVDADPRATGAAPVDLFVGSDLLASHALEIDYAGRRFRLLPSGRMPFRGMVAPLQPGGRAGLYLTEFSLGDQRSHRAMVDTGDGGMVTLTRAAWQTGKTAAVPVTTGVAYGMGGMVETELAILPALRIAAHVASEVELRIEAETGFSARKGVAGRLGGGLLRRYRVLLDPRAGRMILAAAQGDRPLARSTSGLMVARRNDRLKVLHVMRGSPAAAAGWAAGAEICGVDGLPVATAHAAGAVAGWSIGEPGRVVRLKLCNGVERPLKLARFY